MTSSNECWKQWIWRGDQSTIRDWRVHLPPLRFAALFVCIVLALALGLSGCDRSATQDDKAASSDPNHDTPSTSSKSPPSAPPGTTGSSADAEYARLLKDIVDDEGLVRYEMLEAPARLAALKGVTERMAAAPLPSDRAQQLALWCNAYNANALLMTFEESRKPGFTSVNNVPGFFDARKVTVTGKPYTLNELKDEIRSQRDPRIHCALVWGALSCPPLLNEPYDAARLESQLNDQCRRWIEDRSKNVSLNMRADLSEIIRQHQDDFAVEPYGRYQNFVYKFAYPNGTMRALMKRVDGGQVQIGWAEFDWSLNQARRDTTGANKEE